MKKQLIQGASRWVLPTLVLALGLMSYGASAGSFTRGCAMRDLQILMLIEERESSNAISAEAMSEAMSTMLNARAVCQEGRVDDAMALYDGISESIQPDHGLFEHRPSRGP
jgi:hypothetical protein